ncbi:hypothetical protein [Brevundimonas sp. TWP2-3-2]|uniref:hypothetical protein n=1 Tax=unclassified Brevundimonas TaxID=2622653 RepID=UPI003CF6FC10
MTKTKTKEPLIGGKSIDEWDRLWAPVSGGLTTYHPDLRQGVGLYRTRLGDRVTALGTGTDTFGGLAKRLSDFRRPSPSGRRHHAGLLIFEHLDQLEIDVLVMPDGPEARTIGRKLKGPMVRRHKPAWNALAAV